MWLTPVALVLLISWLGLAGLGATVSLAALTVFIVARSRGRRALSYQSVLLPGAVFVGMWMSSFIGVLPYQALVTPYLPGAGHLSMNDALLVDGLVWVALSLVAGLGTVIGGREQQTVPR